MKIIISHKLYNMITNIPLPSHIHLNDCKEAKEAGLIDVDRDNADFVSIYINENFICDVASAIIGFIVPFAGVLSTSYLLGEGLGERLEEIGRKYAPKKKDKCPDDFSEDWDMK